MKFKVKESLLRDTSMEKSVDLNPQAIADVTYASAINDYKKRKKALENDFKEQEKKKDEFIKSNHNRTPKTVQKGLNKLKIAEASTKRATEKKDIADSSAEDLWYAVFDELDANLAGSSTGVNRRVKAKKSERYQNVFPHGDTGIVVYADSPDKFEHARKVADYYDVDISDVKEDNSSRATDEYRYRVIINIPADKLYRTSI